MPEKPPSDPADHAEDFARRYAEPLDIAAGQVMLDLGLADHQMGAYDPDRNRGHHSFFPFGAYGRGRLARGAGHT